MSVLATRIEKLTQAAVVAAPAGQAVGVARRSGFHVTAAATESECTCPHDCERDHPNE